MGKDGNEGSNCLTAVALKQLCKWFSISRLTQSSWEDNQDPYSAFGLSHVCTPAICIHQEICLLNGLRRTCTQRCVSPKLSKSALDSYLYYLACYESRSFDYANPLCRFVRTALPVPETVTVNSCGFLKCGNYWGNRTLKQAVLNNSSLLAFSLTFIVYPPGSNDSRLKQWRLPIMFSVW